MKAACPSCRKSAELPEGSRRCPFCGASLFTSPASPTLPISGATGGPMGEDLLPQGTCLDGYRIERLLGHGGMGVVYLAAETASGRPAALKVLSARLVADPAFVKRFAREAAALEGLSHPNIVRLYAKGQARGCHYVAMEYVDGNTLRQHLEQGPLPPRKAVDLATPLCEALDYAHGRGIVHRDIKPENLLINGRGQLKVADFGLARLVEGPEADLTQTRTVLGTLHYMAPEARVSAKFAAPAADIYSVGVILYEMLTGELPGGHFPAPSQKRWMDRRYDDVVLKALAPEPMRRWPKAGDIARALAGILRETSAEGAAIQFACACGKRLYVDRSRAGQDLMCSGCGKLLRIPSPFCQACGAELLPGASDCLTCGAKVRGTPSR